MKKIAIVYNQSLKQVQGINFVNNSFVEGQKYFKNRGFELSSIFAPDGEFEASYKEKLDLIGSDTVTKSYKRHRKIRLLLRDIFSSKYLIGASLKFYLNHIRNAQLAVNKFISKQEIFDYVIFQDDISAAYYLKIVPKDKRIKSILILHCSKEPLEQMRPIFPALFKNKFWIKWMNNNLDCVFKEVNKIVYLSKRTVNYSPVLDKKKTYIFNGEEDIMNHEFSEVHYPINFVSVASMAWRKGQDYVIEAIAKLPGDIRKQVNYHLIGAGPQLQELKDLVVKYRLENNVFFYGSRNDVPDLLKDMDVFILPSQSEGLPMSIIEALRQGMYIVATDTGAIPEMITPGCGELVERNADKIAKTIEKIVRENVLSLDVKKCAREHYLKFFTLKNMIDKYCDVLESL